MTVCKSVSLRPHMTKFTTLSKYVIVLDITTADLIYSQTIPTHVILSGLKCYILSCILHLGFYFHFLCLIIVRILTYFTKGQWAGKHIWMGIHVYFTAISHS